MSLFKKIALFIPSVRNIKTDLHNRRIRAEEFEAANKILVKHNEELASDVQFMKEQLAKVLGLKNSAISAEASLAANAEHLQGQLSIVKAKYENLKSNFDEMETQNCILQLANDDLLRINAESNKTTKLA